MKILLIEDEPELAESILEYLRSNDLVCEAAGDAKAAAEKIAAYEYDCILLDLMLPDGNGFEILAEIKLLGKTDGVILISAKDTLETRIAGLSLGADDYLAKPFHLSELLARIQALVRRKNFRGSNTLRFEEIEVDVMSRKVTAHGQPLDFTKKESALLLFLIGNQNRILSKNAIAEHLSGDMADMLDNLDFVYSHIKNIKKKLSAAGCADYIKTVYGLGYKWER